MRRYNYFDDEPEVIEPEKKKIEIPKIDFVALAESIKRSSSRLAHGEALKEVKELSSMPNLKRLALKLLAFILFIIFIVVFILVFSHSINSQNKKNALFYTDAGNVCTDCITSYGSVKWESMDSDIYGKDMARLTGLCYARQMDFDNDGSDELMLVYNNKNVYTLEVWSYVKKEFVKVYSGETNSTEDVKDGSWIGLYHQNNKYYICKSEKTEPEKVYLYALKRDTFSKTSSCDYDYKNNIYSVDGKINAQDFETIKFSVIKSSRAEAISEIVIANIDSFNTVSILELENQKTPDQLKAAAYYEIIENRHKMYGKAKVKTDDGKSYIDGVGLVKLVDFNNDGNDELFIVYRKKIKQSATNYYTGEAIIIEEPTYCMEVYSWNGAMAKKIFSKDSISNLLYDNDTNYVMLQNSKNSVDICTNFYKYKSDYTYTASSRIYSLNEEEFEPIFNARLVSEYGYKSYYIDNEYTYRSTFEKKAYIVPMFLDDDGEYDKEKYTVVYLSGDKKETLDAVVSNTVKAIESLNKNYIAEDE